MPDPQRSAPDSSFPGGFPSGFPGGISAPARRALENAGYTRLEQLAAVSEADLKKLHGMGPKAIGILRQALAEKGLSFKT